MGKKNKTEENNNILKTNKPLVFFKLSDFYTNKLTYLNKTVFFTSKITLQDISDFLSIDKFSIAKIVKLKQYDTSYLSDEKIQHIFVDIKTNLKISEIKRVKSINSFNVLDNINWLISERKWDETKVEYITKPPIITIMGHVDHGKTTLLDSIRNSQVTKEEVGGITQKIGAYRINYNKTDLTFIDTPGHEAFTQMRARGSQVTDVVIIVVAADDSIMQQTKESIDHAKAANVNIIIAINKIDSKGANVKKVKNDLSDYGILVEDMGGTYPCVEISALENRGIDKLLDLIILVSTLNKKIVPYNIAASGTILESEFSKLSGNSATIIVINGIIKIGDLILIDNFVSKIKSMIDFQGYNIKFATPSTPVKLFGLGRKVSSGKNFVVIKDNNEKKIIEKSISVASMPQEIEKEKSIDELFADGNNTKKKFKIILKGNSNGIVEALSYKINQLSNDNVDVSVIRKDFGEITNSDVSLAEASNAIIYSFGLKNSSKIEALLKQKNIRNFNFNIIYKFLEDIEERVTGMLEKKFVEEKVGELKILKIFSLSKLGNIAGCIVQSGLVQKSSIAKIYNFNEELIFEGKIKSLKVEKANKSQVDSGRECGIIFEGFNDFSEGDIIKVFNLKKE